MTVPQLTSKGNPLLKTIRLVSSGARRAPRQLVAAEGIRVLEEVERSGFAVEAVVISEDFGSTPRERNLLDRWVAKAVLLYQVKPVLFQYISAVETPQGAIALVRVPQTTFESVPPAQNPLILFACGIQDPGNLGTLIRTAAAAGASLVATTKGTVSVHSPKVIRSSAGSIFRLPLVERAEASNFRHYCERHSIRMYRTDAQEGVAYTEAALASPCAILLGNEGGGISEELFPDLPAIRIPLAPWHRIVECGGGRSHTSLRSAQTAPQQIRKEIRDLI
jgi:RNA methyltransferase, TrmH family